MPLAFAFAPFFAVVLLSTGLMVDLADSAHRRRWQRYALAFSRVA